MVDFDGVAADFQAANKVMMKKISLLLAIMWLILAISHADFRRMHIAVFHGIRLWVQPLPELNSLPNPVPKHRFIDTWGAARSGGRKHEGVDIFAKRGTPVVSNIDGVVWKMENNRLGGTSCGWWGRVVRCIIIRIWIDTVIFSRINMLNAVK